ncbi:MAG: hypothetical protein KF773_29415 [Deltaproteobacteria bacterium]|nr:hypothetical protein [Deltaproteobacteria bacterium]
MNRHAITSLLLATACCARTPTLPTSCLSLDRIRTIRVEDPMTQRAKLMDLNLTHVFDDLLAAQRAAAIGAPAPPLTSKGPCLPEILRLSITFSGDDGPIKALSGGTFDADDARENGMREGYGRFPTEALPALAAFPNVVAIFGPTPTETTLNYSRDEIRLDALRAVFPWMTGLGVTIVVIDTGIEWRHGAFRDANGNTRISMFWDLSAHPKPPGNGSGWPGRAL